MTTVRRRTPAPDRADDAASRRAMERARALVARQVGARPIHVWLFGSRARGDERPGSDIDLAVDAGAPLDPLWLAQLRTAFEDGDIPFKVDVVDLRTAAPALAAAVGREGVPWLDPDDGLTSCRP